MTEVLLEELTDRDIDWITAIGQQQRISANQSLIQQGEPVEAFYIVLAGALVATIVGGRPVLSVGLFSALRENPNSGQDVLHFTVGDVLGETAFFGTPHSVITIRALEESSILILPYEQMRLRLSQDWAFASRFYRAIAILLLKRFEQLLETFARRRGLQVAPLQDGPLLFGELNDGDINWMVEHASVEEVAADQILIRSGRSVETLYIVLRGMLSIFLVESKRQVINDIFSQLQGSDEAVGRQIARARGEKSWVKRPLLHSHLSNFMVKTHQPCLLLALPRQPLSLKLQQDPAMGARFYRVLSILLSSRLEGLLSRLGYGQASYQIGQSLAEAVQYDDELDLDLIDTVNLGGARFDWMLRQLNVRGV